MLPSTNIQSIIGATLFGADDTKLGRITTVLVDAADGHPTFAEVHTGFLGHATRLVPLDDARWERDDVYVSYTSALVKDAPRYEAADGVSPEQEDELRRHYAGAAQDARADAEPTTAAEPTAREATDHDGDGDPDHAGHLDHDHDGDHAGHLVDAGDRDRDSTSDRGGDGERDRAPEHAADVPPVPKIEDGQVLREERLVVRREEVTVDDETSARHAAPPADTPRI
ncbi:PRC-barrel domain-containing protein [Herbiconiux sp. CPCC 205716]|uniref:PRC-barrel domain-containing protein n=1 Tax=Herbiconiux gentiana TaxID=2970912 RepID=A0ABT2GHE0_9MICO|nr:PRC-barrel domain-containing protein [Herbiconiux gentiana]MCS5714211.1 PRC-barrel domain-containing protein [Herbiconiux gentiana]